MLISRSPEIALDLPSSCRGQDSQILTKCQIGWTAEWSLWSCSDGIQIVVDRDAAHTHEVGDVLDRPPQEERPTFIEEAHRYLLAGSIEFGERRTKLLFDTADEIAEGIGERTVEKNRSDIQVSTPKKK